MAPTTLLCKQCNFENEPERVYCHNCGAKLDRSLLPPEASKREDPILIQERVRKIVKPRKINSLKQVKNLAISVLVAAVLAAIYTLAMPPDGVPTLSSEAVMSAPMITDDLEDQIQQPGPHRLTYTDDQVNAFLQSSLRSKEKNDKSVAMKFERAYVHFDEGVCHITFVRSIFGFPLYMTTARQVSIANGKLTSQSVGGSFGRLSIPAKAMPYLEAPFSALWAALESDRKLVSQLQSIGFHKGSTDLITKAVPGGP